MNITFTGNTALELKKKMIEFCKTFNVDLGDERQLSLPGFNEQLKTAASTVLHAKTESQPEQKEAPKKRGPKPKLTKTNTAAASETPQHDETTGETDTLDVAAPTEVTRDMAMSALKQVNDKLGIETARELLSKYMEEGVPPRVSALKETDLANFYQDCQTALG